MSASTIDIIPLELPAELRRQIEREGAAAYPNECCGAIIGCDLSDGLDGKTRRIAERLEPLTNSFEAGEQFHRFSLSPLDLMRAEKSAGAAGKAVLGFYHSHPDHPARPSEYDRQHAWPFYSYIIVAIANRSPVDMTCWLLDEQTEQFVQQPIKQA